MFRGTWMPWGCEVLVPLAFKATTAFEIRMPTPALSAFVIPGKPQEPISWSRVDSDANFSEKKNKFLSSAELNQRPYCRQVSGLIIAPLRNINIRGYICNIESERTPHWLGIWRNERVYRMASSAIITDAHPLDRADRENGRVEDFQNSKSTSLLRMRELEV